MESDHGIKNQKPLKLTRRFLFLGILQATIGLHRKKILVQKY